MGMTRPNYIADARRQASLILATAVAIDLAVGLAHLVNENGLPLLDRSTAFLDLGAEHNLPTWWSSVKLFTIGALFALLVPRLRRWPEVLVVVGFAALVFVMLSLDEFAGIHEFIGRRTRSEALPVSGLWPFLFGGLGLASAGVIAVGGMPLWRRDRTAALCVAGGLALYAVGAAGLDLLVNVIAPESPAMHAATFAEEMLEMFAASAILFGAWRLSAPIPTGSAA